MQQEHTSILNIEMSQMHTLEILMSKSTDYIIYIMSRLFVLVLLRPVLHKPRTVIILVTEAIFSRSSALETKC